MSFPPKKTPTKKGPPDFGKQRALAEALKQHKPKKTASGEFPAVQEKPAPGQDMQE